MSPLRIIILIILFYICYRLLFGGKKKKKISREQPGKASGKASGTMPVNDILEEDPVCNRLVPRQQAVTYQYKGKTYYFCSKKCCDTHRTKQGEHQ